MFEFTIGFSRPKKFNVFGFLIMKIENTNFNHVYIEKYSEYLDETMVYEATIHGVWFKRKELLLDRAEIVDQYKFKLNEDQNKYLLKEIYRNVGKEYGFLQALGNLFLRLGYKINPFKDEDKKLICLEAVGNIMKSLNIVDNSIDFENLGLPELYNIIKIKGEKV